MQVATRPIHPARLAGPIPPRATIPLLLATLLALAPALPAQSPPLRRATLADARLPPPPALRPSPGDSLPPVARVVAGAISGGVIGGVTVGAVGFLLGLGMDPEPEYVPMHHVTAGIGAMAGFPVGAALGARRAATTAAGRPPLDGVLTASVLSAALGGLLWNGIGQSFDSTDGGYTAWYLGAATGISTHLVITSVAAHRAARRLAARGRR